MESAKTVSTTQRVSTAMNVFQSFIVHGESISTKQTCVVHVTVTIFIVLEIVPNLLVVVSAERNSKVLIVTLVQKGILDIPTADHANVTQMEPMEIIVKPLMEGVLVRKTSVEIIVRNVHQVISISLNVNVSCQTTLLI